MRDRASLAGRFFAFTAVLLLISSSAFAADPPPLTAATLSAKLTENCGKLRDEFATALPAQLPTGTCAQPGAAPTEAERTACGPALIKMSTDAFSTLKKTIKSQEDDLKNTLSEKSQVIQRLHVILPGRAAGFEKLVTTAATNAWKGFPPADAKKLPEEAQAKLAEVEEAVKQKLYDGCLASDRAIIEAAFPTPLTPAEEAASSVRIAQQVISDAERDAFAEFSKATGFARSVECMWGTKAENGKRTAALACKPGLLVSGEEVSEIRVIGIPDGHDVTVLAMHAEELQEGTACPPGSDNLTCDQLIISALYPQPISIGVHTMRSVSPTWGGMWGSIGNAKKYLRPKDVKRTKLSLVNEGTPPTIAVGVQVGSEFAAAYIPVGYARWKIESGGFLSVSNMVDQQLVTEPLSGTKVDVKKVRDSDSVVQDSGIFVNFIPQNYQSIGVSLGFATPSNRRLAIYLGPTVRVRTFGNRGLAALAGGLAMRSVLRFPDVTIGEEDADSRVLQGVEQFRFGWFIGLNLGFRIGAFGPQEENED